MSYDSNLKEADRKVFRSAYNDGLLDIFLGCFFLMFVIAPFLSQQLGDFWASAIFIPFWGLIALALFAIRKYVVAPRIGTVKFGRPRRVKLMRFTLIMLSINIIVFILSIFIANNLSSIPGQAHSIAIGLILLIGFSIAGYFLDLPRLYIYGLMIGLSPLVGEWLWNQGLVTHHGFPVTFGITSATMIVVGLLLFIRLLHDNPLPANDFTPEGA